MSTPAKALTRDALGLPAIWIAAGAATLAVGVVQARDPQLIVLSLVLLFGAGAVILAFAEPRVVVCAQIFLLASYSLYVLPTGPVTTGTLVLLALLGYGFRALLLLERPRWPEVEMLLGGILLLIWVASAAIAVDPAASADRVNMLIRNGVLVMLITTVIDSTRWLRLAMWSFVLGAGGMAFLNVLQHVTGAYGSSFGGYAAVDYDRDLVRAAGPLSPNFFAQMLVATLALAIYLALSSRQLPLRVLGFGIALTALAGIVFSYSRASLLVVALVVPMIALLRGVKFRTVASVMASLFVVALVASPGSSTFRQSLVTLYESIVSGQPATDVSVSGRISEQLAAAQMFADHPILGVGPGNYPAYYLQYSTEIGLDDRAEARTPHNLYLEALANTGMLGAVAFCALLWVALRGAWRARSALPPRDALLAEGCFVALTGFLMNSFFLHFAYEEYFWLVLALALAARRIGQTAATASPQHDPALPR